MPYLKLKAVNENEWILVKYKVVNDCSIKEFIEKKEQIFKRGCAFYEFKNEVEYISEDQQLILYKLYVIMHVAIVYYVSYTNIQHVQETKKYFILDTDHKELCEKGMIGGTVLKPSLSKHKVLFKVLV